MILRGLKGSNLASAGDKDRSFSMSLYELTMVKWAALLVGWRIDT